MAISFVGSTSGNSNNGGNVSLNLSLITGLAQNDLVIVAYGTGDNDDVDETLAMVTSGYTAVPGGTDLFANDTQDTNLAVFYKFMGATPDSAAEVAGQGGNDASTAAVAMAFRGVDGTTPFDVNAAVATGTDTANADPPSVDHNNPAGVWTVLAAASGHDGGPSISYTFPSGYTTNADQSNGNDTSDVVCGMGYNNSPSDPENPGALTYSGTDSVNYSWCAVTMALRPAVEAANEVNDITAGDYELLGQLPSIRGASNVNDITQGDYSVLGQLPNVGNGANPSDGLVIFKNNAPQLPGWKMTVSRVGIDG